MVTALVAGLTGIAVARYYGPEGKGGFTLTLLLISQSAAWASFGVELSLIRFGAGDLDHTRKLAGVALGWGLISGALGAMAAAALATMVFEEELPSATESWLPLVALAIVGLSLAVNLQSLLRAQGRMLEVSSLGVLLALSTFCAVGASLMLHSSLGSLIALVSIAYFLSVVASAIVVFRVGLLDTVQLPSFQRMKTMLWYGLRAHPGTVLQGLNYRLDLFVVALFLGSEDIGYYSVSIALAEVVWIVPNAIGAVMLQRGAADDTDRSVPLVKAALRLTSGGVLCAVAVLALSANTLVGFMFGSAFEQSVRPLLLLLPGVWFLSVWKVATGYLVGAGWPQSKSTSSGLAVAITLTLDWVLIPRMGVSGAALASTLAYGAATIRSMMDLSRALGPGSSIRECLFPRTTDIRMLSVGVRSLRHRSRTVPSDDNRED